MGGALLGTMIALVYLLRAIPRWRRVLEADRGGWVNGCCSGRGGGDMMRVCVRVWIGGVGGVRRVRGEVEPGMRWRVLKQGSQSACSA